MKYRERICPLSLALAIMLFIATSVPVFAVADGTVTDIPSATQDSGSPDLPLGLSSRAEEADEFCFFAWLDAPEDSPEGLYGSCSVPVDTAELFLEYAFDGENFMRFTGRSWESEDWAKDGFLPCQLLLDADEPPLSNYLAGTEQSLFVRMCSVNSDGTQQRTEPTEVIRDTADSGTAPLLTMELMETGDAPGLYAALDFIPADAMDIWVEYSFGEEVYYFVDSFQWDLDGSLTQLCIPIDAHPLTAYLSEAVNTLAVRLCIARVDADDLYTNTVTLTHGKAYPLPQTPPPFTAGIRYAYGGYQVDGWFTDFPPDVVSVCPMYSLDGATYQTVDKEYPNDWYLANLGTTDERQRYDLENQTCVTYDEEPLKSYVESKLDRFYLRLKITTESGEYYTQAAVIERGESPLPSGTVVKAAFPFTMRPLDEIGNPLDVPYGQYQVTVRANATPRELAALLPKTLPVEVQFLREDGELLAAGTVDVPANWRAFSPPPLTAGQSVTITNAAEALTVPDGTEVSTPLGNYRLTEPLAFSESEVRLLLDVVGANEKPDVSLQVNDYDNALEDIGALSLAFRLKPSGAVAIKAYAFVDGDEKWSKLCDLLSRKALDHNQAAGLYGYVTVLQPQDAPFADYLSKKISGFCIGLTIEGGTFDGEKVILPWPGNYDPPRYIPEPGGSEGNENNAGAGSGGDSNEGGQRPNLPQEKSSAPKKPLTTPLPPTAETLTLDTHQAAQGSDGEQGSFTAFKEISNEPPHVAENQTKIDALITVDDVPPDNPIETQTVRQPTALQTNTALPVAVVVLVGGIAAVVGTTGAGRLLGILRKLFLRK